MKQYNAGAERLGKCIHKYNYLESHLENKSNKHKGDTKTQVRLRII